MLFCTYIAADRRDIGSFAQVDRFRIALLDEGYGLEKAYYIVDFASSPTSHKIKSNEGLTSAVAKIS